MQYVNPRDGAEYVSPKTTIIIRPGDILDVLSIKNKTLLSVNGSVSGNHTGVLDISDDERTLLFQPEKDFVLGEVVTVTLHDGLKTQKGNDIKSFSFSFIISLTKSVNVRSSTVASPEIQSSYQTKSRTDEHKKSRSSFQKINDEFPPDYPKFEILVNDNPAPGDFFVSTNYDQSQGINPYISILENSGKPLFYRQLDNEVRDFKMQPNGTLSYFSLPYPSRFYVLDSSYAIVDSFMSGNGYDTDFHDLQVLPNGHALLLTSDYQIVDMSKYVQDGFTAAVVTGLIIQEIDKQKRVVFEWRSWDHFEIMDAIGVDFTQPTINYVWGNSLEYDHDGNIILSSRNMCEVTKIDRQTGNIIWRFGGKNNQFTFINDTLGFNYQHDARRLPNGNLTLLDNGNLRQPPFSRAVEYHLDESAKTATLVWQYRNTPDVFSLNQGNVQRLPNGNTLIGWGYAHPTLTEVRPDGTKTYEFNFISEYVFTYRSFKFPWKTSATSVKETPSQFSLGQNYPNPISFQSQNNSCTTIQYSLSKREHVQLTMYDLFGREVETFVDDVRDSGQHIVTFDGRFLSSGVYFYRIITPTSTQTRSLIITK